MLLPLGTGHCLLLGPSSSWGRFLHQGNQGLCHWGLPSECHPCKQGQVAQGRDKRFYSISQDTSWSTRQQELLAWGTRLPREQGLGSWLSLP